ncbi:MAG TPA: ABC transporter permease subunit [Dehalococcoidia bacterium]|nr:ABC transporter permease subunit [Dehalococcoidia bacterium]
MTTGESTPAALMPGFSVLLRKELQEAIRSRRVILFVAIICLAVSLVPIIGYFQIVEEGTGVRHQISADSMNALLTGWTALVGFLGSLMAVAATVDAVSRERSLGIAAWIVTKPVSRMSYLGAKALAHTIVAIGTLVVAPTAVFAMLAGALFQGLPAAHVLVAALILCIEMGFLSFFIVALGVPFRSVTPIAILGLAVWFLPTFVPNIGALRWTYRILPSYLPVAAYDAALDQATSATVSVPAAAIACAAGLFGAAVIMFERQEL